MAQVRLTRVAARTTSPVAVLAALPPSTTVDSLASVTITAQIQTGSPDSYAWRVISGPATLAASGASAVLTAPADLNGATVVVGVAPVTAGVQGAEVTAMVTVRPHTMWLRDAGAWVPGRWVESLTFDLLASTAFPGLYDTTTGDAVTVSSAGRGLYDVNAGSGLTESGTYPDLYEGI